MARTGLPTRVRVLAVAAAALSLACTEERGEARASLRVESVPRGATVRVDGRDVGLTTPATLANLEINRAYEISVARDGYLSRPDSRTIVASPSSEPVRFELVPKVDLRVRTVPPGAVVILDERRLGQAPLEVAIERGTTHQITVTATDFLPKRVAWVAEADETLEVELEPAVRVDVASSPSPASVLIDGEVRGQTPSMIDVPASRRFELVARRPGYRDARRRLDGRRLAYGDTVTLSLRPLPLSSLPLSPAERSEVRRIQAELDRARSRLSRTRALHDRSVQQLERIGRGGDVHVTARLDGVIDATAGRIEELELTVQDLEGQLEGIRDRATEPR